MTDKAVGEWSPGQPPVDEPVETIGVDFDLDPTPTDDQPPPPRFATLPEFVEDFLSEMLWTDIEVNARTWCPQWWRHPAGIVRLDALHRSFEHLRQDPGTGISTWLRDHADYHMGILTDPNGPFKGCSATRGHDADRSRTIPVTPTPDGLFDEND